MRYLRWKTSSNFQQRRYEKTLFAELKACSITGNLELGQKAHSKAIESGNSSCLYVASALVNMYGKCRSMVGARQVFDNIKHPDVALWTALILGYAQNGEGIIALELFARMKYQCCAPNSITFVAVLKACTSLALDQEGNAKAECLELGKQVHSEISCHLDAHVESTLIDMYAKCGNMTEARRVFDGMKHLDVVAWTALILGYAENGKGVAALELFARMKHQGCEPNKITYVAALKACMSLVMEQDAIGRAECLERGKQIHSQISCHLDIHVQSTLIDMYSKCGNMVEAHQVFGGIKHPDVVAWTALIFGYAENGEGLTALDLFASMKSEGWMPNSVTFIAALKACSLLGALELGCIVHAEIGTECNVIIVTCLVDCYAKCGSVLKAKKVFDSHSRTRDLRTWTALLAGYSRLGDTKAAFDLFDAMQYAGFRPNGVTFLCILTCCSHAGMVEKANEIFKAMVTNYGINPTVEHYTCMIDSLGRSNKLDDAMILLRSMPCRPNAVTWVTVLGACRKWENVEIGRVAFKSLVNLDDKIAASYVLMAHIYRSRGMLEEQEVVLGMRSKFNAWKEPGQSCWTDEVGEVHSFLDGDNRHPQTRKIQKKLEDLALLMRNNGYVPDFPHHNSREETLLGHCEKLALVCALVNTAPRKTIRIVKNIRVCDDCHTATALISRLEHRTIICRDASRFHVFTDGKCSCGDVW